MFVRFYCAITAGALGLNNSAPTAFACVRPTFAGGLGRRQQKSNLKVTGFGPRIFRSGRTECERRIGLGCSGGGGGSPSKKTKRRKAE